MSEETPDLLSIHRCEHDNDLNAGRGSQLCESNIPGQYTQLLARIEALVVWCYQRGDWYVTVFTRDREKRVAIVR